MKTVTGHKATFRYDFLGTDSDDVVITVPQSAIENGPGDKTIVTISMEDMSKFMAYYIRYRTIENFTAMTDHDVLDWAVAGFDNDSCSMTYDRS